MKNTTPQRLYFYAGWSAIYSGIFAVLSALTIWTAMVLEPARLVADVFLTITNLLTTFAVMGIYFKQAEKAGTDGLVGFVLVILGGMLDAPVSWAAYLFGLLLLALANHKTRINTRLAFWLWFGGSLLSVIGALEISNAVLGFGLIVSGMGRILIGFELNNAWHLAPSPSAPNHIH